MFPGLFYALRDYAGSNLVADVLSPQLAEARAELEELIPLRRAGGKHPGFDALHTFYALGRVYEWLVLGEQRGLPGARAGHDVVVDAAQRARFFEQLGFERFEHVVSRYRDVGAAFHPFFHEIVDVREDPAATHTTVVHVFWPGFLWGDMLFARAGVTVRCPPGTCDPALAVRSPLYFAYDRLHRTARDLSHGWGHNSQWATAFRRDYVTPTHFAYNVDGHWSIEADEPKDPDDRGTLLGLDRATRVELLRYRSLVRARRLPDCDDLWPYHDRYEEPR